MHRYARACYAFTVAISILSAGSHAFAQNLPASTYNSVAKTAAVDGQPFGVFVTELPLPANLIVSNESEVPRVLVTEANGRVFYPVVTVRKEQVVPKRAERPRRIGRPGGLLDRVRSALQEKGKAREVPVALTISGLYRGKGALRISLQGDVKQTLEIEATQNADRGELLKLWWQSYVENASRQVAGKDFPALVHKYLTSMLAGRLNLPPVDLDATEEDEKKSSKPLETLALLAAIEPLREDILEDVLNGRIGGEKASLPLPAAPTWQPPLAGLAPGVELEIESLASRVPPECFYLRFGSFANFVWFQDIAQRYGGDFAQAVLLRGFNYEATAKLERMLAAKMTAMAKMFGGNFVGDLALVGSDLYMKEGAGIGMIFYAKSPQILKQTIESERRAVAKRNKDASFEELSIAGKKVVLLSTPDNRIRSFFVADGNYVCVTTSLNIVTRFLEVGQGAPSLAQSQHFRWARSWMPDANDYSVFAYFSPEFFQRLVSPQFQIELNRRLQAIAHLETAELATQAGIAEGLARQDLQSLQASGLLPESFDRRADGSQTLRFNDAWIDSARGARGCFAPIVDVPVEQVTRQEAEGYRATAEFYQEQWKQMDPMMFGVRRFAAADGTNRERVTLEGYIAPFQPKKYGWVAEMLAPPQRIEIQQPADDVASLMVQMSGTNGLLASGGDDYMMFAGVKDSRPPNLNSDLGILKTFFALKAIPAYLGAWPKPDLIEQLPLGLGISLAQPDFQGFSRMLGGLWRWQDNAFSLLSFDRGILESVVPQLEVRPAQDAAQVRLQVQEIQGTQLADWFNEIWYQRAWSSSRGNSQLLDVVHQQLKVPAADCMDVTERLLDVQLQCPLGGKYELVQAGKSGWWESDAWENTRLLQDGQVQKPEEYEAPWIDWYRGGRVHLTQGENSLAVVGELDLELKPLPIQASDVVPLPSLDFDVFSLPSKIFGGAADEKPETRRKSF